MIIFHHIPKSAGTTVSTAIVDANDAPSRVIGSEGISAHDPGELTQLAFLSGHVTFPEIRPLLADRETTHFSILRHPLERLISYFEMVYRDNAFFRDQICFKDKWSYGFDLFLDRFVDAASLNNLMCGYFHPSRRFYDAAHVITEKFDFVGSMDDLPAVTHYLEHALPAAGLVAPSTLPKLNVSTKNEPFWRTIPGKTLDRVRESNRQDMLLYDWLIERHGGTFEQAQGPKTSLRAVAQSAMAS